MDCSIKRVYWSKVEFNWKCSCSIVKLDCYRIVGCEIFCLIIYVYNGINLGINMNNKFVLLLMVIFILGLINMVYLSDFEYYFEYEEMIKIIEELVNKNGINIGIIGL